MIIKYLVGLGRKLGVILMNKLSEMTGLDKDNRLLAIRDANSVKKQDRTDRMEDYLEVIYELVQKGICYNGRHFKLP